MQTSGQPAAQAPTGQLPPVHATRKAPLCVQCMHIKSPQHTFCCHPAAPVDLVSGAASWQCYQMRNAQSPCGPMGLLFEPAPEPKPARQAFTSGTPDEAPL